MSEPGKCCGTCVFWDRMTDDNCGRCEWRPPVMPKVLRMQVILGTYNYEGHDCPCYEQSGEAEGK